MLSALDRFNLVHSEAEGLKEYLQGLAPGDLDRPSACERWQAGHVLAHLVWIGEFYSLITSRALQGLTDPPEESPRGSRYRDLSSDDFYTQKAFEYRQNLGDRLVPALGTHYDRLHRLLMRMSLEEREKPCHYPSGERPVWSIADMAVQELAIHRWDIESRQQPEAHLSRESLPLLLERLRQRGLRNASLDTGEAGPVRVRFETTGAVPARIDLVFQDTGNRVEPAGDAPARVTVQGDTEDLVLLLYGRLPFAAGVARGQFTVAGDRELAESFGKNFP